MPQNTLEKWQHLQDEIARLRAGLGEVKASHECLRTFANDLLAGERIMNREIARLREALGPFVKAAEKCEFLDRRIQDNIPIPIDDLLRARAALDRAVDITGDFGSCVGYL